MKRSNLCTGLAFVALGLAFIVLSVLSGEERMASRFAGFAGGMGVPGLVIIWKYFYWTKPERRELYQERLQNEKINLTDERKVMIRGVSAQVMYRLTILALALLAFGCSFLGADKWLLLLLGGLILFELAGGYIVYRHYSGKM